MLDQTELDKYFTKEQQKDIIELYRLCASIPTTRSRRPRVRKVTPGHIPRPVNSFMTFRAEKQSVIRKFCPYANHREISKIVAQWWHKMSSEDKAEYVMKAAEAKVEHSKRYPDYVFKPKSKKQKKPSTSEKPLQFKESPHNRSDFFKIEPSDTIITEEVHMVNVDGSSYYGDSHMPSSTLYDDLGWPLSNAGQDMYNIDIEKYNDIQGVIPTFEATIETPMLDYAQSPLLPEESFRSRNEYCNYNNGVAVPPLDSNSVLYYPYDNLSFSHAQY